LGQSSVSRDRTEWRMENKADGAAPSDVVQQLIDKVDGLEEALLSRDVIGQAKGILMAREGLTSEQAFDVLRRASQRENRKLYEVARNLVERNSSPDEPQ